MDATSTRPRPPIFRALGKHEPPEGVCLANVPYVRETIFKHDSWAATALYRSETGERAVIKFNRQQSVLGIPMVWLGRRLARREARFLRRLATLEGVPAPLEPVTLNGAQLANAVAHVYVEGRPLCSADRLEPEFLGRLRDLIVSVHARNIAYVDLHKRENILLGADGQPHLVDFQVSFRLPRRGPLSGRLGRTLLTALQQADRYHLVKHECRLAAEPVPDASARIDAARPAWLNLHRCLGVPLRTLRRRLLVLLGIRQGKGYAETEVFAEDAIRAERQLASKPSLRQAA